MNEQTSRKSGMKSTAKKLQPGSRARFGFDPAPASNKVSGAFGKEEPEEVTSRGGRSLNVNPDLSNRPSEDEEEEQQ
jgi:hypothetical protein